MKVKSLIQVPGLRSLILNGNPKFTDAGLRFLVNALKEDFWLRVLNLKSCGLEKKGGESIVELLKINCTITTINFSQNKISLKISRIVENVMKKRREGEKKLLPTKKVNSDSKIKKSMKLIKTLRKNKQLSTIVTENLVSQKKAEKVGFQYVYLHL